MTGEILAKFLIVLSFFVCYGWFYHLMARDEKLFENLSSKRLEIIETLERPFSNQTF